MTNPVEEQTRENSFFSALIYAINVIINEETQKLEDEVLKDKIGRELFEKLNSKKQICILDLDRAKFDNMCFDINEILIGHNLFLRVYERKDEFRYLFHKNEEKTDPIKSLSTCLMVNFNGFNILCPYLETRQKKDLRPIDIIYEPVRNQNAVIKRFFSTDIRFAYVGRIPKSGRTALNRPYQCYYCSTFFERKSVFERHIKNCSGKPGIVYNFNIQNIVTFEDNLKYMSDVPFSVYGDFETTAPCGDFTSPENNKMFAVSYALVFEWHPKLNLPRQCVVRGFNHSIDQRSVSGHELFDSRAASIKKANNSRTAKRCCHSST